MEEEIKTFEVGVEKQEGLRQSVKAREHEITLDMPEKKGGTDRGMHPIEALLGTLGACFSIIANKLGQKRGIEIGDIDLTVKGKLDARSPFREDVKKGLQEIILKVEKIEGIPEDQRNEFIETTMKSCRITDCLEGGSAELKLEY